MKIKHYKSGDIEDNIWVGDLVTTCEFVKYLPFGIMVFRDLSFGGLRTVYYEKDGLNGWCYHFTMKELIKDIQKRISNYD